MDKILEAILLTLGRLEARQDQLADSFTEVAERFEEIATLIEHERRLDRYYEEE